MPFASDRDVLALEPSVFRDIVFEPQVLVRASDGLIAGSVLSSLSSDFEAAGVDAGSVIVIGETAREVIARLSATTLSLSQLRASVNDPVIPVPSGTGLTILVGTFLPQITESHQRVMRALGTTAPEDESAVVVDEHLRRLEAIGALQHVYAAAANEPSPDDPSWARGLWYGDRFARELRRVTLRLDADGDGVAEITRRVQPTRMVRE